jgi:inner membrane protein
MRGDQHVSISLFSAGLAVAPSITIIDPSLTAAILFGIFVGSLAPDADAVDAAIFNGRIDGMKGKRGQILNAFAVVLPAFGYTIRYLIYYPLSLVFEVILRKNYRHQHRGLLHSLIGVLLTTCILLAYLAALFTWLGWTLSGLPAFGAAFFAGCVLHLLEDTCTPSGIAWLFPFSRRRLAGRLNTNGRFELRPALFALVLSIGTAVILVAPYLVPASPRDLSLMAIGAALILWLAFLLACRVRLQQGRRTVG